MLYGMANNNVIIPAERDGALYNFLMGGQDYVFKGIGNEFAITPSASSFLVTLGTGEGVVCGRHVTEETSEGTNSMLQLEANSTGYVVIRIDLSRPAGAEAFLHATPTLSQDDLNNNGTVHDLPLYRYTTNGSGVSAFNDVRNLSAGSNVVCKLINGKAYVWSYDNGTITQQQLGSIDPSQLTAVASDVKAGKTFAGAGSEDTQTGTFTGMQANVSATKIARTFTPASGFYYSSVKVDAIMYKTTRQTVTIAGAHTRQNVTFTFAGVTEIFGIKKIKKVSGSEYITLFDGYPGSGTGENALNIPSTDISDLGNTITLNFLNNVDLPNQSAVIEVTVACN